MEDETRENTMQSVELVPSADTYKEVPFISMNIQRIKETLSIPPGDRRDFEIRMVMEWLRSRVNIFKDVKDNILINLVKECRTVTKEADEMIIREGDIGDCMYILMSGYLHVYRKYDQVETEDNRKTNRKDRPVGNVSVTFYPDRSPLGEEVVVLNAPGTVFGEIALIEDCPRTASIVADSTAVLLLVQRDLYNRTVRSVIEAEFQTKLDFINHDPLFSQWNLKLKNQLAMALEILYFDYDVAVVRQGQRVKGLFFILQGEVLLSACPDQHLLQYPRLAQSHGDSESRMYGLRKAVDIALLDGCNAIKSSCVGDIECLSRLDTYLYTAMTTQNTVALILHLKNFDRIMVKRTPEAGRRMRTNAVRRLEAWLRRTGDQLPLLQTVHSRLQVEGPLSSLLADASSLGDPSQAKHKPRAGDKRPGKFVLPKWGPLVDQTGPGTVFHYIRLQDKLRKEKGNARVVIPQQQQQQPAVGQPEEAPEEISNELEDALSVVQVDPAFDAQTSETALSSLESKMREFLEDKPQSVHNAKSQVVKLARFNPEDTRPLPKGGYVILLRPRPVLSLPSSSIGARFPQLPSVLMKGRSESAGRPPSFEIISSRSSEHPTNRQLALRSRARTFQ